MGSATREALASAVAAFSTVEGGDDLTCGEQLLESGRIIGGSPPLRSVLADHSTGTAEKRGILGALFSSYLPATLNLLGAIVAGRWSSANDLLAGIEEIGIRAIAASAPAQPAIEAELYDFAQLVRSSSALEFAIGSKLGSVESKADIVDALLAGKATPQTRAIIRHLVQQPRDRRIGELLRFAISIVVDQAGLALATVISAKSLRPEQLDRLRRGLELRYGRGLRINQVNDPALIGGVRVEIGADVIDGTVATKIKNLRLQLAR